MPCSMENDGCKVRICCDVINDSQVLADHNLVVVEHMGINHDELLLWLDLGVPICQSHSVFR